MKRLEIALEQETFNSAVLDIDNSAEQAQLVQTSIALNQGIKGVEVAIEQLSRLEKLKKVLESSSKPSRTTLKLAQITTESIRTQLNMVKIEGYSLESFTEENYSLESITQFAKSIFDAIVKTIKWILTLIADIVTLGYYSKGKENKQKIEEIKKETKSNIENIRTSTQLNIQVRNFYEGQANITAQDLIKQITHSLKTVEILKNFNKYIESSATTLDAVFTDLISKNTDDSKEILRIHQDTSNQFFNRELTHGTPRSHYYNAPANGDNINDLYLDGFSRGYFILFYHDQNNLWSSIEATKSEKLDFTMPVLYLQSAQNALNYIDSIEKLADSVSKYNDFFTSVMNKVEKRLKATDSKIDKINQEDIDTIQLQETMKFFRAFQKLLVNNKTITKWMNGTVTDHINLAAIIGKAMKA